MTNTASPDILVIGGGPAGSTAAALLAMRGRDTLLVEKEAHPRFHIGESLLPANLDILERLGVLEEVRDIGVHKPGAEFVSDRTGRSCAFPFAHALNRNRTHAWQVKRAELDALLFANARRKGATTLENTRVTDVQFGAPGERATVRARTGGGEELTFRPRYVLDASGRDTFLAGRMRVKAMNKYNNTAAIYAHFQGVERRSGELDGYISIHLAEDGWFWLIPLPGDVMSIGFVGNQSAWKGRKGTPQELFEARIASSPTVAARTRGAEMVSEIYSTGNYSYRAQQGCGEGFLMIGDAYGFVDPMFSTGVLMAMTAGELGAKAAHAWLDDPVQGHRLAQRTNRELAQAMDRISWLIYRINDPVMRSLFMAPRNTLWMRDGIINMLAGNLRGDPRAVVPILSFKAVFHTLSALHRIGLGPAMPEALPERLPAAAE
ncbi:NAD(P)/FAD-dependent oxidoreductase [Roseococcus sp. SYP-B2431]|uniref:NAD(P)/FAD-dependent oxidoreductase n=1 Tax=Roseococcus sp. SYP-B2431 TaxID=2496640 RepID=UPI00104048F8|nr:NAD(P)/FAD-dependent oxidoreductase [Roseococcus sp. SYP-B2431]TCH98009.1 NAD(P)/FAD-dependent oxidoreductase [Roseococcus sp. SYP-B2431]